MSDQRFFSGKVIFNGNAAITVPSLPADPSGTNGDIYYNTTDNKFRKYENGAWSDFGSGGSSSNVNKITLNAFDILNGFVTLSSAPATPANTILSVIGGPVQDYGVDFTISGTQLSWTGLGLDGILEDMDKLVIQFD